MIRFLYLFLSFFFCLGLQAAPTEVVLWHAMAGPLGEEVEQLAKTFNARQSHYVVKPIYKGSYLETLTAFSAAYRAHRQPAMVQVYEVGTATMLYPKGVTKPVGPLLDKYGMSWKQQDLWPALNAFYSPFGHLSALPFNVSLPVMYYNASRLKALGIRADTLPQTWQALEPLLEKLNENKAGCAYTSAYPAWIHIEAFQALNGHKPALLESHLNRLQRWQSQHWFEYAGRIDEATALFTSGKCALFTQSSGAYQSLASVAPFEVGVSAMPVDALASRQANVVGGGALWVSSGLSQEVEKGAAQFLSMLLEPKIQENWSKKTGYLPILKSTPSPLFHLVERDWGQQTYSSPISKAQNRIRAMNDETLELFLASRIQLNRMTYELAKSRDYAAYRFDKNHGS